MNNQFLRNGLLTLVLVVGTAALLYMFLFQPTQSQDIPYSGESAAGGVASLQQQVAQRRGGQRHPAR